MICGWLKSVVPSARDWLSFWLLITLVLVGRRSWENGSEWILSIPYCLPANYSLLNMCKGNSCFNCWEYSQGDFQALFTSPGNNRASCFNGIFLDTSKYDFLKKENPCRNNAIISERPRYAQGRFSFQSIKQCLYWGLTKSWIQVYVLPIMTLDPSSSYH